jgi:tripartite-type tricarboxylate transporter receptor subunit TctC
MLRIGLVVVAAALAAAVAPASAQDEFPSHAITIIVPTPPGGGVDIVHRLIGELAEPILGQKVVIENKPGASGTIGLAALAASKPDGYTLAAVWNAPLTIAPHTLTIPYDVNDFAPVTQTTGGTPLIFCVRSDFPANNGAEFVEYARNHPDELTYGTDGVGALVQLSGERLFSPLGLKLRAVPFGGAGETLQNFLGGHIDIYGGTIPPIAAQLQEGKAKCMITTAVKPIADLPVAASAADLNLADNATELWRGLIAPNGTPPERIAKLAEAFRQASLQPKFQQYLEKSGEHAVFGSPEEFSTMVAAESKAFAKVVESIGLTKK